MNCFHLGLLTGMLVPPASHTFLLQVLVWLVVKTHSGLFSNASFSETPPGHSPTLPK